MARPGVDRTPAVQRQDVYEIKSPLMLQPGPAALTDGLAELQRISVDIALIGFAPPGLKTPPPNSSSGNHPGNLHHYWDVEFVERLGTDPREIAVTLIGQISEEQRQAWSSGTPADWAMEAFALAQRDAYGLLPPPVDRAIYSLPSAYTEQATRDVTLQLSRAGVRLAMVLNQALAAAQN